MTYLPLSCFPLFAQRLETIRAWASSDTLFGQKAQAAMVSVEAARDAAEFLDAVHRLQRVEIIGRLKVQDNSVIVALIDDPTMKTWKDYNRLPATPAQCDILADLLYGGDPQRRAPILLTLSDYGRGIGELIVQKCINKGVEFDPHIDDALFHNTLLGLLDEEQIATYGEFKASRRENVQRTVTMYLDQENAPVDPARAKMYANAFEARKKQYTRNQFYTATRLPTSAGAMIDGMTYQEYVDLFFRMCAVDWEQIGEAHKVLIAKLNAGKILRLTNDDGTDLTMDIEGFTFVNSRVAKNVPGSEVFSAPRRNSVNGIVVANGKFAEKVTRQVVENIRLEFKDGRVVRYDADKGIEFLQQAIETDEGSHYVGEIGIGTNPALKQHSINSLMVEKIGGSFHIALGSAYEYTDYLGDPVHLDNGNRSKIHWDITTMLFGKNGKMILDGEEIMTDGFFVDPRLAYLNDNI